MIHPDRVISGTTAAIVAALLACSGRPHAPAPSCAGDEQCDGAAWCTADRCVENSPPTAAFTVSGSLVSRAVITLDGSASADPDERDHVATHDWSVESRSGACAAPTIAGHDPTATVAFECTGIFRIQLVVKDLKGAPSAAVTHDVEIAQGPSTKVTAGASQAVQHLCTGSPLRCQPEGAVKLSASITGETTGPVVYRWTAIPPSNRPLDVGRRISFSPAATAAAPTVTLETDGAPISGDYVFRVEARDDVSALGTAETRVSVLDRAPVVELAAAVQYPHSYDATAHLYRSSGTVALSVVDPDGDPVTRRIEWRHAGDGGGEFGGEDHGATATFAVAASTPAALIGGSGLQRSLWVSADDGNGGTAQASAAVVIGNQPPVAEAASAVVTHTYDAVNGVYASFPGKVALWSDPDGDPLTGVAATGDAHCAGTLGTDRWESVVCTLAHGGAATLSGFLGTRQFSVSAADPWQVGSAPIALTITNRPPAVASATLAVKYSCSPSPTLCCHPMPGYCASYATRLAGGVTPLALEVSDPDNDPLAVSAFAGALPVTLNCPAGVCTGKVTVPPEDSCGGTFASHSVSVQASDGQILTTGVLTIAPQCQ